jgi:hypothetical protein
MATKSNPAGQSGMTGGTSDKSTKMGAAARTASKGEDTSVMESAMESGGKIAGNAIDKAKERTSSMIEEQKHNLASGLDTVAQEIRRVGSGLETSGESNQIASLAAGYSGTLAGGIERVSDYLERHDVQDFVNDVQDFARRHPGIFVGGAFLVGMAATRFLKSGSERSQTGSMRRGDRSMPSSLMPPEERTGRAELPRSTM